jgi:hypothetical protein
MHTRSTLDVIRIYAHYFMYNLQHMHKYTVYICYIFTHVRIHMPMRTCIILNPQLPLRMDTSLNLCTSNYLVTYTHLSSRFERIQYIKLSGSMYIIHSSLSEWIHLSIYVHKTISRLCIRAYKINTDLHTHI